MNLHSLSLSVGAQEVLIDPGMECITNLALLDNNLPACLWLHVPSFASVFISLFILHGHHLDLYSLFHKSPDVLLPPVTDVLLCWFGFTIFFFFFLLTASLSVTRSLNDLSQLLPFLIYWPINNTSIHLTLDYERKIIETYQNDLKKLLTRIFLFEDCCCSSGGQSNTSRADFLLIKRSLLLNLSLY